MCRKAVEQVCPTVCTAVLLHQLLPSGANGDGTQLLSGLHALASFHRDPWHEAKVQIQVSP